MLLPGQRSGSLSPMPGARSSNRDSTSHTRHSIGEGENDGLRRRRWPERGGRSYRSQDRLQRHRGRPRIPDNDRDLDIENTTLDSSICHEGHNPDTAVDSSFEHNSRRSSFSAPEKEDRLSHFEAHRLHQICSVDHSILGVGESLRSPLSTPVLPPTPNGEAVPVLLSHLAGEIVKLCRFFV